MPVRTEKVAEVAAIKDRLARSQAVVLTDYRGLDVQEITELRRKLRDAGVEYKVVKNTLLRLAAHDADITVLDPLLEGPTAAAFSYNDPVPSAKILTTFANTHKELEIKGALLDGKFIDVDGVKALADLPSREVLLAQVLAGFQAPIAGFVNVLHGTLRNLVYAVEAIRKQKAGE